VQGLVYHVGCWDRKVRQAATRTDDLK
jgi:hypothetical protein